jgi:hypothetical protein
MTGADTGTICDPSTPRTGRASIAAGGAICAPACATHAGGSNPGTALNASVQHLLSMIVLGWYDNGHASDRAARRMRMALTSSVLKVLAAGNP